MIIDITNEITDRLITDFPEIVILTAYPEVQKEFPCVIVEELSNDANQLTKDTSGYKHSLVGIAIEIFTVGADRMSKAKEIRKDIDAIISDEYGMLRITDRPTPNMDTDIYRYTMRFTGLVDENREIFRG